jgi:hypothetical protein
MDNSFFEGHSDKLNIFDNIRLEIKVGCSQQLWISVLDLSTLDNFRITTTEVDVLSEKKINLFTYNK